MTRAWWYYVPHAILVGAAIWLLYRLRLVLAPFAIAYFLAVMLDPVVDYLETKRWRRTWAVAAVFALLAGLFIGLAVLIIPVAVAQVRQLAADAPQYAQETQHFAANLQARLGRAGLPPYIQDAVAPQARAAAVQITSRLEKWAEEVVGSLGFLIWLVIIPVATALLLKDIDRIRARSLWLVPERHRDRAEDVAAAAARVLVRYLRGLVTVAAMFGIVIFFILLMFRIPYSLALGLMAGVLYSVPYLGNFVTILTILIVGVVTHGWTGGLMAAAVAIVATQVFDQILTPRLLGRSVELHPVVNMMAVLVGGALFGLVGVVIAVPVAGMLRAVALCLSPWLRSAPPEAV